MCCNSSDSNWHACDVFFRLTPTYTDCIIGCFAFSGCVRLFFSISSWHPQLAFSSPPPPHFFFLIEFFNMLNVCGEHCSPLHTLLCFALLWLRWRCSAEQYDLLGFTTLNWHEASLAAAAVKYLLWTTTSNWFNSTVNVSVSAQTDFFLGGL